MKAISGIQEATLSPIGGLGGIVDQAILKKHDPKLSDKLGDIFTGRQMARRIYREFGYEAPLEIEQKPDSLKDSTAAKKRDARRLATVRRSSIDG